jgi:hypothetical protein
MGLDDEYYLSNSTRVLSSLFISPPLLGADTNVTPFNLGQKPAQPGGQREKGHCRNVFLPRLEVGLSLPGHVGPQRVSAALVAFWRDDLVAFAFFRRCIYLHLFRKQRMETPLMEVAPLRMVALPLVDFRYLWHTTCISQLQRWAYFAMFLIAPIAGRRVVPFNPRRSGTGGLSSSTLARIVGCSHSAIAHL